MAKTALITGASRGIGWSTALLLAQEGWNIAAGYRESSGAARALIAALREKGCDAECFPADLADGEAAEAMARAALARFGRIDLLVNNAGFAQQKLFCDIAPEEWERMFAVTVTAAYRCCRAILPGMIARREGRIVNVSSVWGIAGASCEVHYSAAKAALIGMTKALAREVGPSGITINCVAPGVIDTDMCAGFDEAARGALCAETPLGRLGTADDIARCIAFLAGPGGDFITGQVVSPNGGFVI